MGSIAIFPPTLYIYEIEEINLVISEYLTFINYVDWYMVVNQSIINIYKSKIDYRS